MNTLIDKILDEWSYRVNDGMPNPKNPLHIVQLRESMEYLQIPETVINGFVNNLTEADIVKNKESGNTYVVQKHNYEYLFLSIFY